MYAPLAALGTKMTAEQVHATVTQDGTWVSYGGPARTVLAVVLVAAAAGAVYAGARLRRPLRLPRPGETARTFMVVAWGVAIVAFLACVAIYADAAARDHSFRSVPADPITPVTAGCVVAIFAAICFLGRSHGRRVMLASAAIGAVAAPMIFEFPFDLIVMARTYPAITPHPDLYRALFFAPLFLTEFMTLSLLCISPMVRLGKAAFFLFASMLTVFAVWGLEGFAYPSAPVPFALNVLSKVLAFAAALSLFLPERDHGGVPAPTGTVTYARR